MYEGEDHIYCYPGTSVLKNRLGVENQEELNKIESFFVGKRTREGLPRGRLSYSHYRAVNRHLFQDIYRWAGRVRRVQIAKGGSVFCLPEYIDGQMRVLF